MAKKMFLKAIKSSGFDIENTHLQDIEIIQNSFADQL